MANAKDSLRLVLISLNELKQVAVLAAAEGFGSQLFSMGVVKGKEQLEALLETAGADHYVVSYNEPFASTFKASAFAHSAEQIVADLEKGFRAAKERSDGLKRGETLDDEEQARLRFAPRSWMVWASAVESSDGITRIRSWFETNKTSTSQEK
jgi:hypothetical protein